MDKDAPVNDDEIPSTEMSARTAGRLQDAVWVREAQAGDRDAFGRLYDAWVDRVFNLVVRIVHDREVAADVCQDTFLSAWRSLGGLQDPDAFGGWLLRIARNASFNRSGTEARSRPVDDVGLAVIERSGTAPGVAPPGFGIGAGGEDPLAAAADGEIAALVQEVVAALGERDAEVLDLQLRYELTPAEIGEVIGVNRNAANQLCHRVRGRFATAFGARMLWRGKRPACDELDQVLATAGVLAFGPDAVKIADRHAQNCAVCAERRESRLRPEVLFAAVPLIVVPAAVKIGIASVLGGHGVPMHGSAAAARGTGSGSGPSPSHSPGLGHDAPVGPDPGAELELAASPGPANAVMSSAMKRRGVAAAAVVGVVAAVALVAVLTGGGNTGDSTRVRADGPTTSSSPSGPGLVAPDAGPGVADPGPGASGPNPGGAAPPPGVEVGAPVIDLFELDPSSPQGSTWTIGPGSPTLSWRVTGAASVEIWTWFDDGKNGPAKLQLVSTDASGQESVCPGTITPPATCNAPAGSYTYIVEVTGNDTSAITSDRVHPPGFQVIQTIQ